MDEHVEQIILRELKTAFGDVYAACLYGSQVCGYATEGSDYDVLLVIDEYGPGVKYSYVDSDGIEIAFLGVSKKVFEDDVQSAAYGGFIADRIINPYFPLINEEYTSRCELERKKVIVNWETTKLILKNKEDAKSIDINLLYYPFKKWNKIATIYRPYRYSIENTLRRDLKEKNLKALLPAYQKAIKELGYLREIYPGWYRIEPEHVDKTLETGLPAKLERIRMVEREIEDTVARYLREKGLSSPLTDPERFLLYPDRGGLAHG